MCYYNYDLRVSAVSAQDLLVVRKFVGQNYITLHLHYINKDLMENVLNCHVASLCRILDFEVKYDLDTFFSAASMRLTHTILNTKW